MGTLLTASDSGSTQGALRSSVLVEAQEHKRCNGRDAHHTYVARGPPGCVGANISSLRLLSGGQSVDPSPTSHREGTGQGRGGGGGSTNRAACSRCQPANAPC